MLLVQSCARHVSVRSPVPEVGLQVTSEATEVIKGAATQRLGPGEGRRPHVNIGRSEHTFYIFYNADTSCVTK